MWCILTINSHFAGHGMEWRGRVAHSFMNKLEVEQVFVPSVTSIENSLIRYVGLIEILTTWTVLNTVPNCFWQFDAVIDTVKILKCRRNLQNNFIAPLLYPETHNFAYPRFEP